MLNWTLDKYGKPYAEVFKNNELLGISIELNGDYVVKRIPENYTHVAFYTLPGECVISKGWTNNVEEAKKACEELFGEPKKETKSKPVESKVENVITDEVENVLVNLEDICGIVCDKIKYTTNGKPVNSASKIYKEAFSVVKGTPVNWVAYLNGEEVSKGDFIA